MGKRINHHLYKRVILFMTLMGSFLIASEKSFADEQRRMECPSPLSSINLFGEPFNAGSGNLQAFCVGPTAYSDAVGIPACAANANGRGAEFTAVNPGNPQYGLGLSSDQNTLTQNSLGYYYCVPRNSNSKERMCREADRARYGGMRYQWHPVGNDGNCLCYSEQGTAEQRSASMANCNRSHEQAQVQPPQEDEQPDDEIVVTASRTSPEADSQSADITRARQEFIQCVEGAAMRANRCREAAESTQQSCNPEQAQSSSTRAQLGEVIGAAGGMYAQANANTGAQSECFRAGLLANGARMALTPSRSSCSDNVTSCFETCSEERYTEYREQCAEILPRVRPNTDVSMELLEQDTQDTPEGRVVQLKDREIREGFAEGRRLCQASRGSQDTLNNLLTGLGNALQQSMICACQLSASAVSGAAPTTVDQANANGCNAIPNPDDCAANPALPNCNLYDSVNVCTPGAGYNAAACNCQMNPRAAGCPGATAGDGTSNFAGAAIGTARPGDTVSFAGLAGGGGGRGGGIDLSTSEDPEQLALGENNINRAADALPRTPGAGGAGGAGSSGGGAPAGEAGLLVDGEPKKGLSGLLTTLTNRAGRFFGARERTNGNIRIKPGSGKGGDPSMARFRPRGLASTGVGTKNMDIWRMMNMCVQGDTCKRNVNNYITGP